MNSTLSDELEEEFRDALSLVLTRYRFEKITPHTTRSMARAAVAVLEAVVDEMAERDRKRMDA